MTTMDDKSHKKYLTTIMSEKISHLNTCHDFESRVTVITDLFDVLEKNSDFIEVHFPSSFRHVICIKLLEFRREEILLEEKYDVFLYWR